MPLSDLSGRKLGSATCPVCGCDAARVTVNAGGKSVTLVCPPVHDAGCNTQVFGRSPKSIRLIAERIKTWNDGDARKVVLGSDGPADKPKPAPKPPRKPAGDPAPQNEPTPAPSPVTPPKRGMFDWLDKELT